MPEEKSELPKAERVDSGLNSSPRSSESERERVNLVLSEISLYACQQRRASSVLACPSKRRAVSRPIAEMTLVDHY